MPTRLPRTRAVSLSSSSSLSSSTRVSRSSRVSSRVAALAAMALSHPLCRALLLLSLALCFAVTWAKIEPNESSSSSGGGEEGILSNLFNPGSLIGGSPRSRAPPSPPARGFSDQSAYVGLPAGAAGLAVGVADFNRDRFADLLVVDGSSLRAFGVRLWDHDAYTFRTPAAPVLLDGPAVKAAEAAAGARPMGKISAAFVADFSNDGILDVLVADGVQARLFFGAGDGAFNASAPAVVNELPPVAAVVDADADFVPDVFVVFRNHSRGFWRFRPANNSNNNSSRPTPDVVAAYAEFVPWPGGQNRASNGAPCATPDDMAGGIAFADMDGDCLPDLIVPTTCGLEVWSNVAAATTAGAEGQRRAFWNLTAARSAHDLQLLRVFNYNHGDRAIAVADFDADGTNDVAVVNRNRHDMLVYRNVQRRRGVGALCTRDDAWALEKRVGLVNGVNLLKPRVGPLVGGINLPPALHVGDYDLDGMPDLLAVDAASNQPVIFRNRGAWTDRQRADAPQFERLSRTLENGLSDSAAAVAAAFFDTDESGRQDVLVVRARNHTRLVWNSVNERWDALFFKGTLLSAVDNHAAEPPRPFAPAPVIGATFKLSYMERGSRHRIHRTCSQSPHSNSFFQLTPGNCQFGLQAIANYIEELWVGAAASTRSWNNLMPNSIAIIWADATDNPAAWWMEYFTQRRGSQMLRVTAILMGGLVLLGGIILYLQHREMKEDRQRDESESARLFNFVV